MSILRNKDNIQPPVKYNPPTMHECSIDGKDAGMCLVYDPAAWGNKNKAGSESRKEKNRQAKPEPTGRKVAFK